MNEKHGGTVILSKRALEGRVPIPSDAKAKLHDKWEAMLVAEVKQHGGIPHLSKEELDFREAMAEFLIGSG